MLKQQVHLSVCLLIIIKIFLGIAIADPAVYTIGEHFKVLNTDGVTNLGLDKVDPVDTEKPQVLMFFNYGCYGCWLVNKDFAKWRSTHSKTVDIYYYPVSFNPMWENLSKFYYVNQELQPHEDNEKIFVALHGEHKKLWLESEMIKFYSQKQISEKVFLNRYRSFDVERKVKRATEIAKMYDIRVTPNIIVNVKKNSYMINFTMVQNAETLFKIIDYLIKENPS